MRLITPILLVVAMAFPASAAASNVWAVSPAAGAAVASNYPLLKWDVSEGWTPTTVQVSRSSGVGGDGMLADPLYTFDVSNEYVYEDSPWRMEGEPWFDMAAWSDVFGKSALFPGVYFWQVSGSPFNGFVDRGVVEMSPVRRLVVKRIVGKLDSVAGDETEGESSVAFPLTISMRTNVPRVRLAFAMRWNGHMICRGNRPMTFDYGTDQSVSRTIMCRVPFAIYKGEDKNACVVTVSVGTRADIGRTARSVSRTTC